MKSLIILYVAGVILLAMGYHYYLYETTLALWENPDLRGDPMLWPPILQEKHAVLLYPYRADAVVLMVVAVVSCWLSPSVLVYALRRS